MDRTGASNGTATYERSHHTTSGKQEKKGHWKKKIRMTQTRKGKAKRRNRKDNNNQKRLQKKQTSPNIISKKMRIQEERQNPKGYQTQNSKKMKLLSSMRHSTWNKMKIRCRMEIHWKVT